MAGTSDLCAPVDGYVGSDALARLLMALLFSVTTIPTIGIEYSHIGSRHILSIASSSSSSQDAFNYRPSS